MVEDLVSFAPSCIVGTQGVLLLDRCRNPLLATTGKYHLSSDSRKSTEISRVEAYSNWNFSSFLRYFPFLGSYVSSLLILLFLCTFFSRIISVIIEDISVSIK